MTDLSAADWAQISPLLDAALELNEADRARWLTDLATRDPQLAARVAEVLAASEQPGFAGFLGRPPPLANADAVAATLVGRQVGPYIIEAEIGQGGMGSVWRARRADGRYEGVVAIKFVRAALMGQLGEQRFHVEGRLLGRLNHPNIARLLDAGIAENQPYLVLEYVEGKPLDVHCARLGLNLQQRLHLFLDVLAAVSHAHKHLIVHKDIKPSNIFVTSAGEVKLLDFGIAKLLDVEGEPGAATQTSAALMTPQFAAPEQLLGQPVTTATDVYSAGLVLYLLLTGCHPIRSASQSSAELIQSVLTKDFPRPSTVAELDTVSPAALAGDLDNIIARALNKSPLERYPSASAFAEDLQRYLANLPVQARPATVRYRVRKFVRRNRGAVAAAALVALSLLAGTVGTVVQAKRAQANAVQALEARQRALRQLTYAEATNEFLLFLLEDESNKSFTTRDLLLRGETLANQEFADDPQLRAKLLLALAGMYEEMEESKKAQGLLLSAQQAARAGADRSLAVEADCALGLGLGGGGQYRESLDLLGSGIRAAAEDPAVEPGVHALCLANRGAVYVELKQGGTALGDAQDALTILGTPRPGQHRLVLFARQALADAHDLQGDYPGGVEEYQQVLNELERMGRGQTSYAMSILNGFGVKLARSGQWLRAAAAYESTLAKTREAEGSDARPALESNYAKLLVDLGRAAEARPLFDRALEVATRRNDPRSIMFATLLSAPAWCATGDVVECESRLKKAEGLARTLLPPTHTAFGTLAEAKGELELARHQPAAARGYLQATIDFFNSSGDKSPTEIRARLHLAEADLQLGDLSTAATDAHDAAERAREALHGFRSSAWLGSALLVQGEVYAARGDKDTARQDLEEALKQLRETEGDGAPATREAQSALRSVSVSNSERPRAPGSQSR